MSLTLRYKITLLVAFIMTVAFTIVFYHLFSNTTVDPKTFKGLLFFSAIIVIALSIVCASLVLFLIAEPITEVVTVLDKIGQGDLSARADISAGDAFENLTRTINEMNEKIDLRMQEIISNRSKFEAVLLSMFEGLMVVDRRGLILLMNKPLKGFFHVSEDPIAKKPIEVIRNVEIQEVTDKILMMREGVESCELSILLPNEKILLVHGTPVIRQGMVDGAVLVFHDITELRHLERVRQDFVANVSHELRTPVATIKGYTETLLDGALDDKEHALEFLKIIHTDADRLAKLINDLLDLSRIESGKFFPQLKKQPLDPIISRLVTIVKPQAQALSIHIENKISGALPDIELDETLVAQAFLNLLENAVKYNREGGKVIIDAQVTDKYVRVSIADTGIGIPQEDISRVFERFYRVDKAHSRQMGGTGLGLSIVKHIIQAHGGDISVQSALEQGSTFFVTLPRV